MKGLPINEMANKEIEKAAKKAFIAEIKLAEIIKGAGNCQPRPGYLGHLTDKREYDW